MEREMTTVPLNLQFQFNVQAADGRGKTDTATVSIRVDSIGGPPKFLSTPYSVNSLPVSSPVGKSIFSVNCRDPDTGVCYFWI